MDELRLQMASELPLECGKCNRTDQVRVVGDEISCHFCGNYAIVGVRARFPFVEPREVREKRAGETFLAGWFGSANNSDGKGQSPLQVVESIQKNGATNGGSSRIAENISAKEHASSTASRGRPGSGLAVDEESVKERSNYSKNIPEPAQQAVITEEMAAKDCKPKQEEPIMSRNPQCKVEGCTKIGAFLGLCAQDFKAEYGITYRQYMKYRYVKSEDPRDVALRIKAAAGGYPDKPEKKKPVRETKQPKDETKQPRTETPPAPEPGKDEEKGSTGSAPELEKPNPPRRAIGLVGKDFITIVCKEEFIEKIKEQANAEFRTPEQQVAWYLHQGMKAVGS